jgi:hypothetical protein
MKPYHRIVTWKKQDHEAVKAAWMEVFERPLLHKNPRQNRWCGRYMVGTGQMTEDREDKLLSILGKKVRLYDKVPKLWFDV